MNWQVKGFITPEPPGSGPGSEHFGTRSAAGFRYIARGFWVRDGQLLALASLDEAAVFFGPSLSLHAFRWEGSSGSWTDHGIVSQDAINNFPPRRLRDGEWLMSRRRHNYKQAGVEFLIGGVKAWMIGSRIPCSAATPSLKRRNPNGGNCPTATW